MSNEGITAWCSCGEPFVLDQPGRWSHTCSQQAEAHYTVAGPVNPGQIPYVPGLGQQPMSQPAAPPPVQPFACDGPGCTKTYAGDFPLPLPWRQVRQRGVLLQEFCSLRCLANWLALELAKEETR